MRLQKATIENVMIMIVDVEERQTLETYELSSEEFNIVLNALIGGYIDFFENEHYFD
jgi:hypothetical protein